MRLTADILLRAETYLNPYGDREINLRGFKIPAIENLSVIQDQFDCIDFSENDIKKLDNFPKMSRLNCLLLHHNSVSRLSPTLGAQLPKLSTLVLTSNRLTRLSELLHLSSLPLLEVLSLLENPVTAQPHYRLFLIHQLPRLKWLDFAKVRREEREAAKKLFSSATGKAFLKKVNQEGEGGTEVSSGKGLSGGLSAGQKAQVRKAIEGASTKQEIDEIELQLKLGTFPFISEGDGSADG